MEKALQELFARQYGTPVETIAPLKGDGSGRSVYRLIGGKQTVVGVIGPDRLENAAFLSFSKHFRSCGLSVPEIYAVDKEAGVYLEEDLGDTTLFQFLAQQRGLGGLSGGAIDAYEESVRQLPRFQILAGKTLDYSACYPRSSFDKQSMLWDLNYFKYYFLRLAGVPFSEQALEDDFERLTEFLLKAPRGFFLYRDFQSRNIMLRGGRPWFIDYQGGRTGALQYDIASLLFDAKADLPFEVRDRLLELYIKEAGALTPIDRESFLEYYHGYVFIRIMQALGAYGLRGFYERKTHFLQSIPYAVRNLEHLLHAADLPVRLPALMEIFKRLVASPELRQFGGASLTLTVRVQSFSYKNGMPADDKGHGGGFVFDCRALPNPGRHERYAQQTGRDRDVIEYLEAEPAVGRFLDNVCGLVDAAVEDYRGRNFTDLMVAFGCTGGRHRSVYCAEFLARRLREKFAVAVEVRHREQG
jgi:aminoglycoside/choline kinase family phosphotransferase